jgi:flagellar biogenesis protein FliO
VKTSTLIDERAGNLLPSGLSPFSSLWSLVRRLFANVHIQRKERKLRLCDTLALGEKRMIAVVEFEQQRFLVAATPNNISLLQTLPAQAGDEKRASEGA